MAQARQRVKRLLRHLEQLQQDDAVITAPVLKAARFLLQYSSRHCCVRVVYDELAASSFDVDRTGVPQFITSQLEAQKLIDQSSDRLPVSTILFFILHSLVVDIESEESFPTLFAWYSSCKHRTYIVIAYVELKMESRVYTIEQLLAMKAQQTTDILTSLVRCNPDVAAMIRKNNHNETAQSATHRPDRKFPQISTINRRDDSSTDSEEVLFKGNACRRQVSAQCLQMPPSLAAAPAATARDSHIEQSLEPEWKYRGRRDSEVTTNEPLPAPPGIPAQMSEGFQRFYKAVASPTHVRVTAGGRIVPNIRGPPSPTSKRLADDAPTSSNSASNKHDPAPLVFAQQMPAAMPQFMAVPPGFHPVASHMSLVPMAFSPVAPPGFQISRGVAGPGFKGSSPDEMLRETQNQKVKEAPAEAWTEATNPNKVKISPPDQFDHTKPFLYNGQWMYPVSGPFHPSSHFMHVPMLGPQPIVRQSMPSSIAASTATQVRSSQEEGRTFLPHRGEMDASGASEVVPSITTASRTNLPKALAMPPISSIRPSEITKRQIATFRQSLKYHEDQLHYNRHQIDEKDMAQKVKVILEHIARFEALLNSQLQNEASCYPKTDRSKDLEASKPEAVSCLSKQDDLNASSTGMPDFLRQKENRTLAHGSLRTSEGLTTGQIKYKFEEAATGSSFIDPVKRSGLPVDAALAPPFKPRGDRIHNNQAEVDSNIVRGCGFDNVNLPSFDQEVVLASTPLGWANTNSDEYVRDSSKAPNALAIDSQSGSTRTKANFGVPYLVGTLPRGVNPRNAQDSDYQYSRELTEDERRARFLFWGKAPRSALRGLPKYDGKHFYPPSPVKHRYANSSPEAAFSRQYSDEDAPTKHDRRISKSDNDPFRFVIPNEGGQTSVSCSDESCSSTNRASSVASHRCDTSNGAQRIVEQFKPPTGLSLANAVGKSGSITDSGSALSLDRRSDKASGVKLWGAMLKKGATSSALSSTTAQGYLPQYAGFASKSLSPTVNKASFVPSKREGSPVKTPTDVMDINVGGALLASVLEDGENRRPSDRAPFESEDRGKLEAGVNSKTPAVFPPFNM